MISSPNFYIEKGIGVLSDGKISRRVSFEVFLVNQEVVIFCKPAEGAPHIFLDSKRLNLIGKTAGGDVVRADNLFFRMITYDYIELISNEKVYIGDYYDSKSYASRIDFYISNLFDVNLTFSFNDYTIVIKSERESIKQKISKYWKLPQVGSIITIKKASESVEEYLKIINYVLWIVSLATGRHLSFGIQHIFNDERNYKAVHNNFSSYNYIHDIIPINSVKHLLSNGLIKLNGFDDSKLIDIRTVLEYLNDTDHGYLDDRILRIVQCWEIVSNTWNIRKQNHSPELAELKSILKQTLKEWHKKFPEFDKDCLIDDRIHKGIEWEKVINLLKGTLIEFNLDNSILKIDFPKLIKLRNSVAHKGRIGDEDALDDLLKAQFGIRLVLLRLLGYDGQLINYIADNSIVMIKEFLIDR